MYFNTGCHCVEAILSHLLVTNIIKEKEQVTFLFHNNPLLSFLHSCLLLLSSLLLPLLLSFHLSFFPSLPTHLLYTPRTHHQQHTAHKTYRILEPSTRPEAQPQATTPPHHNHTTQPMFSLPSQDELPDTEPVVAADGTVDYYNTYKKLQQRFAVVEQTATTLFDTENASRQTLNYLKRRNNALLDFLATVEPQSQAEGSFERLALLAQLCPRIADALEPILAMEDGGPIDKKYVENLFLEEKVADLINDDVSQLESDPTQPEAWCHRHGHPGLVLTDFAVGDIPVDGVQAAYYGTGVETHWGEGDKSKAKKKKPEKKKK